MYPSSGIYYLYTNLQDSIFQKTGNKIYYFIKVATDFAVLGSDNVQSYMDILPENERKIFSSNVDVYLTEYATYGSRIQ